MQLREFPKLTIADPKPKKRSNDTPFTAHRVVLHEIKDAGALRELQPARPCRPQELESDILQMFDRLIGSRLRLLKGDTLFRPGERFSALYAIRCGSCKTVLLSPDGRDQVSGYHMAGDIIGTDGIGSDMHDCQAIALEDMEVCALPFARIEELGHSNQRVTQNMHRLLAREITRERHVMLMLGTMHADQRLAVFLLDLAGRYRARGYSACEFVLRMTRDEIGSYLGLKLETVSRLLSRMHRDGLILVQGRVIKLLDTPRLKHIIDTSV